MRTGFGRIVLGLGLVIGSGSAADAVNFCFNPGVTDVFYNSLAVAQKFHVPRKGACSPVTGFDTGSTDYRSVFGTACLNSAGDTLHVDYVTTSSVRVTQVVDMDLPYPSLSGGDGYVSTDGSGGSGFRSSNAHANPCIPQGIPIP